MYCTNCGNEIKEGAKYCPRCGTPVADHKEIVPAQKGKGKPRWILALGAVCVVCAIAAGVVFMSGRKTADTSGKGKTAATEKNQVTENVTEWIPVRNEEIGLCGYIDEKGEEVIPCQYIDEGEFSENGLAAVQNDEELWGYINEKASCIL